MSSGMIKNEAMEVQAKDLSLPVVLFDEPSNMGVIKFPGTQKLKKITVSELHHLVLPTVAPAENPSLIRQIFLAEYKRLLKHSDFRDCPEYQYKLGILAKSSGEYEIADSQLMAASQCITDDDFKLDFADLRLAQANVADALPLYKELAENGNVQATLRLAEIALSNGEVQHASQQLFSLVESGVLDWRTDLFTGGICLYQGNIEQAVFLLKRASLTRPRSSTVNFNLALAHYLNRNITGALKAARKAVGLNPYQEKHVAFFIDLLLEKGNQRALESALPLLERYMEYDEKSEAVKERYAQVAQFVRQSGRAIKLLEKVPENARTGSLLNNLGVLNWDLKRAGNSYKLFYEAFQKASKENNRDLENTALTNCAVVLLKNQEFDTLIDLVQGLLEHRELAELCIDDKLYKAVYCYLSALLSIHRTEQAKALAIAVINEPKAEPKLVFDVAASLVYINTMMEYQPEAAVEYAKIACNALESISDNNPARKNLALNNLVFALAESGRLDEASQLSSQLRHDLYTGQFVFATQGLLALRKGHLERGEKLYRKSIAMAKTPGRAALLKKKMYYELATLICKSDSRTAMRYLNSARKIRVAGDPWPPLALDKKVDDLEQKIRKILNSPRERR